MGTASTESRNRKRGSQTIASPEIVASAASVAVNESADIPERTWRIAGISIFVVAAVLRIYNLNLVPLHHDEGVNGNFLVRLVREGFYHYDPANYHGPTLYYFAAAFPWSLRLLFGTSAQNSYGLTTTTIRLVPALFGLATIALIFTLRRNLGSLATLSAALLLAISPGAVYLSRYFIHETLFVFFTLGLVVAALKFYERARLFYLIVASISAALMFATKETAIISAAVLVIVLVVTHLYRAIRGSASGRTKKKKRKAPATEENSFSSFVERVGGARNLAIWLGLAVLVFIAVNVLFYSSFFTNYPKGVYDALKTFEFWAKTGKEAHKHPKFTYFWWLLLQESPLLILGAIGAATAVLKPAKSFALFAALWAFGLIAAYSLIAYKTPWLALNFGLPLALCSGVAIQSFYLELRSWGFSRRRRWFALAGILLIAIGPLPGLARIFDQVESQNPWPGLVPALGKAEMNWKTFIPGYQTIDLNFINYDNDNRYYVYVYAHTRRETLKLVDEINRIAQRSHQGGATGITIVSPDYWPLPWYLRDYNRVGFYGRITPSNEPMILASSSQRAEVQATYGDRYQQVQSGFNPEGSFPLRPGVDLLLFARRELLR
ncbi:MAG: flippase activity-associated protein Agl23 [Pyrinomonadaceae bacterium]